MRRTTHSRQPPPSPTRKANAGGGMRECNRQTVQKLALTPEKP